MAFAAMAALWQLSQTQQTDKVQKCPILYVLEIEECYSFMLYREIIQYWWNLFHPARQTAAIFQWIITLKPDAGSLLQIFPRNIQTTSSFSLAEILAKSACVLHDFFIQNYLQDAELLMYYTNLNTAIFN